MVNTTCQSNKCTQSKLLTSFYHGPPKRYPITASLCPVSPPLMCFTCAALCNLSTWYVFIHFESHSTPLCALVLAVGAKSPLVLGSGIILYMYITLHCQKEPRAQWCVRNANIYTFVFVFIY